MKDFLITTGETVLSYPLPFFVYALLVNLTAFLLYGIDKRRAIKGLYRISEAALLLFGVLGGAMGSIIGMTAFRHKTKHKKFLILVPLLFLAYTAFLASSLIFALLSHYGT